MFNKKEIQIEYKSNFNQLRKILNSWNLIPGAPNDEFDSLNHKILSNLYNNKDNGNIQRIIESDLIVYYGLNSSELDSMLMISEILEWWKNKGI